MRLIASFDDQQTAHTVQAIFMEAGIEASVTLVQEAPSGMYKHQVWVVSEEDVDRALDLYNMWCEDPARIAHAHQHIESDEEAEPLIKGPIKVQARSPLVMIRRSGMLTRWVILLCVTLFLWNGYQKGILAKTTPALMEYFGLTSLMLHLLYDTPPVFQEVYAFFVAHPDIKLDEMERWPLALQKQLEELDKTPYWKGYYPVLIEKEGSFTGVTDPSFTKIKEGELWRLFTPALLHGNFLHILFNMLWLWLLGKETESRIGKLRYVFLMILLGIICNTAQYVASGPLFMGYSGVVCGLGGFIWVRQKKAPWEGYTVPQGTLLFLFIFILGMLVLQGIALFVAAMSWGEFSVGRIGNTAHIVGLISGMMFAKIPLFYRVRS